MHKFFFFRVSLFFTLILNFNNVLGQNTFKMYREKISCGYIISQDFIQGSTQPIGSTLLNTKTGEERKSKFLITEVIHLLPNNNLLVKVPSVSGSPDKTLLLNQNLEKLNLPNDLIPSFVFNDVLICIKDGRSFILPLTLNFDSLQIYESILIPINEYLLSSIKNGKRALCDKNFKPITGFEFDNFVKLSENHVRFERNNYHGLMSSKGEILLDSIKSHLDARSNIGCFFINPKLTIIKIPTKEVIFESSTFTNAKFLENGYTLLRNNANKYFIIDSLGNKVFPSLFSSVKVEKNNFLLVSEGLTSYVLDANMNRINIPAVGIIDDSKFITKKNDKFGIVDLNNNVILPHTYSGIGESYNGIRRLLKDPVGPARVGLLSTEFKELNIGIVNDVTDFDNGYAFIRYYGTSLGLIDSNLNVLRREKNSFANGLSRDYELFFSFLMQPTLQPTNTISNPPTVVYASDPITGSKTNTVLYYVQNGIIYARDGFTGEITNNPLKYIVGNTVYASDAYTGAKTNKVLYYIENGIVYASDAYTGAKTNIKLRYIQNNIVYATDAITNEKTNVILKYIVGNEITD
jgi:hypothetical protein